jgi:hypothetical protein
MVYAPLTRQCDSRRIREQDAIAVDDEDRVRRGFDQIAVEVHQ